MYMNRFYNYAMKCERVQKLARAAVAVYPPPLRSPDASVPALNPVDIHHKIPRADGAGQDGRA